MPSSVFGMTFSMDPRRSTVPLAIIDLTQQNGNLYILPIGYDGRPALRPPVPAGAATRF
jgi:hypothetical protein